MEREHETVQNDASEPHARDDEKATWQRPELVRMGHLKDFVQGGGKLGTAFDMDPNQTKKNSLG